MVEMIVEKDGILVDSSVVPSQLRI